ncbi:DUF6876 family protein [Methylobacter sp.]|uniref:DUF6876 family protein n=1 Tax=Methylobacter sp. TaxID=2051955 RepID=UPI003DA2C1A8
MNITPNDLSAFNCTENYYKTIFNNVVYTDGMKYFFTNGGDNGAYWFLDYILFEILPKCGDEEFISIEVNVEDNKASIKAHNGNYNYLYDQNIPYTDLADGTWKFWIEIGECGGKSVRVILLPSEH